LIKDYNNNKKLNNAEKQTQINNILSKLKEYNTTQVEKTLIKVNKSK
jgi:hypothetical protein